MAEVVKEMPDRAYGGKGRWSDPFMDGQIWRLSKGTDFKCKVEAARAYMAQSARKVNKRAVTRRVGDDLFVQVVDK